MSDTPGPVFNIPPDCRLEMGSILLRLFAHSVNSGYRRGWVWCQFRELQPTFAEVCFAARILGYRHAWAKRQWQQIEAERAAKFSEYATQLN